MMPIKIIFEIKLNICRLHKKKYYNYGDLKIFDNKKISLDVEK